MNKVIFVLYIFFLSHVISAQETFYYSFNEDVELQSQTIYDIHEDSELNIWIATNEGLYKWNGLKLQLFKNVNYSSAYTNLQESETGLICCQNFNGQFFYALENELKLYEDMSEYVSGHIDYNIAYLPSVYYFTEFGLLESNSITKEKIKYNYYVAENQNDSATFIKNNFFLDPLSGPIKIEEGFFLTGRSSPISFNKNTKLFSDYFEERSLWPERKMMSFNLQEDVIFCFAKNTYHNCYYRRLGEHDWHKVEFDKTITVNVTALLYDKKNQRVLLGHSQGLGQINLANNTFTDLIQNIDVSKILSDREENLWLSTLNKGLVIIPNLENIFIELETSNNHFITAKNRLFIISDLGKIFEYKNCKLRKVNDLNKTHSVGRPFYNSYSNSINFEKAKEVYKVDENKFETSQTEIGIKDRDYLSESVWTLCMSSQLSINSKSKKEIGKFRNFFTEDTVLTKLNNLDDFRIILRDKRCYSACVSKDQSIIYAAFSDGLFMFKNNEQQEILFQSKPIITNNLLMSKEEIWFANNANQMLRLKQGKVDFILTARERITDYAINNEFLVIGTINGLIKYNLKQKKSTFLNNTDGLRSNYIDEVHLFNDSVFINTKKGISIIPTHFESQNNVPSVIDLLSIKVNERLTAKSNLTVLSHTENNFYFEFKAINQKARGTFQYQYKMEGIDSTWQEQAGNLNSCRYPALPPGEYKFLLKAINEDGFESEILSTPISIAFPFYQKWWFYILIAVVLVLVVSVSFIIRIKVIKKRNKLLSDAQFMEKELSKSQLMALKSQMNPHFVFNALNSIQDYIINNKKELASDYLGLFADLMRKYLNLSQEDYISLDEEIETLNMYLKLEKVRFEETLSYSVNHSEMIDLSAYMVPTMLIQPFVENSIKHGLLHKEGERILTINFEVENEMLFIRIIDNGIGRAKSQEFQKFRSKEHKSFATSALQERLKLINSSGEYKIDIIYTDLKIPSGTEVEIRIKKSF